MALPILFNSFVYISKTIDYTYTNATCQGNG